MANTPMSSKKGGSWTKVVIFISLYILLLESVIEWALVLYLYVDQRVDMKMTPSLILALIASFFTAPLAVLHSLLAWQYNKVSGYSAQKTMLRTTCTYLLRLTTIIWLAASVAGLVVVSQHASCLPDTANGSFWKVGVSCALHRAVVIVAVLSFMTVCLYFCSRELCERPYDVSLLGVYRRQRSVCDESIFSSSSLESEALKNEVPYFCPGAETAFGARNPYCPSTENSFDKATAINIQYPTPAHARHHLGPDGNLLENADVLSGSTLATYNGPVRTSRGASLSADLPTTFHTPPPIPNDPPFLHAPAVELPGSTADEQTSSHKRQKSSLSSLRKYLPKAFPLSQPLSADPQIQALADPNVPQATTAKPTQKQATSKPPSTAQQIPDEKEALVAPGTAQISPPRLPMSHESTNTLPRSLSSSSSDAPEVVPPAPLKVQTPPHTTPIRRTIHRHQPTYTIIPPNPLAWHPVNRTTSHRASVVEPDRQPSQSTSTTRPKERRRSQPYQLDQTQVPPRQTRSQYHPHHRNSYRGRYEPRRAPSQSRRPDVEIHYPSTRRPRSSTCGGLGATGALDSIRETGASVDETRDVIPNAHTYRGATRTSMAP
ncbi:hypothetical protein BDV25DRAFT_144660 [Aspergillus avenaceus]|uniref:Uncharacterized protein n=1 Tax=Aspergillus avenaceus TaxID=36643 RepID=A0A5N6TGI4_ASPAV|nr:hypothetical protein BDV25DRAFT_144660 [Aspergillus avenaceus]